jgi:AcrR family transcriptional regulator
MSSSSKTKPVFDRRQQIIDVAAKVCREQGLQKMSLRGVAKQIGISAPSLYEYFKNKDALIDALRGLERTRLAIKLNENLDLPKSIKNQLFDICKTYIEFAVEQPDSFQLLFSLPTGRESVDIDPEEGSPYLPLVKTCREAIESGEVADYIDDPEILAFQLWSLMHGIASLRSATLRDVSFEIEPMIDKAINQALTGAFLRN